MQKINPIRVKQINSSHLKDFKELFLLDLKFLYWSEKQQLKLLYRLAKASSTKYLKACFKGHLLATQTHINRLGKIFILLNEKSVSKRCAETDKLISEAAHAVRSTFKNTLSRDLGIIEAVKKMESLEIQKYNQLVNISNELGNFEITLLLEKTLMEEQEAQETFDAVMEDTLRDEMFNAVSGDATGEVLEETEELEAV